MNKKSLEKLYEKLLDTKRVIQVYCGAADYLQIEEYFRTKKDVYYRKGFELSSGFQYYTLYTDKNKPPMFINQVLDMDRKEHEKIFVTRSKHTSTIKKLK